MTASFGPARRRHALRDVLRALASALILALAGCGNGEGDDGDAGLDATFVPSDADPFRPDGARDCTMDEQCDDGVGCTRDVCDPRGYCRNPTDFAVCDDGNFCNGVEQCDREEGVCVPGPRETCNDDDVCTVDRCSEAERMCEHTARDLDEDGDPDFFCAGGGDCDDTDPTRHSRYPEVCGDGIDNDCDDETDEDTCGRGANDVCDDAIDVSAGGVFVVNTQGLAADYAMRCAEAPRPGSQRGDFPLWFRIDAPRDVRIQARGPSTRTGVSLRTACPDRESEIDCRYGLSATVRRRALPAGTYYVIVSSDAVGDVAVQIDLTAPTTAPTHETCATAQDLGEGGTFSGDIVDVSDDLSIECGAAAAPDLVYQFTTLAERDVRISASTPTGDNIAWNLRSTCDDAASSLRCAFGQPASGVVHQVPPGTYYVVLEDPSAAEADFTLAVDLLEPTPPLEGDSCANAIPLPLDMRVEGSLEGMEDDHATSCGYRFRDVVYAFTLTERRDVTLDVDGAGRAVNASVRTSCGDPETQLGCVRGAPVRRRFYDLAPGTYYVIVEALAAMPFAITVAAGAPTAPTPVRGNETCTSAHVVPATGGVFTGDTGPMLDDLRTRTCGDMARSSDAVFRIDLPAPRRVIATTDGSSFDTVLHLHSGSCVSEAETLCDDDSGEGPASLLDRTLDAGTHFLVVDGRGMVSSGLYTLGVQVFAP